MASCMATALRAPVALAAAFPFLSMSLIAVGSATEAHTAPISQTLPGSACATAVSSNVDIVGDVGDAVCLHQTQTISASLAREEAKEASKSKKETNQSVGAGPASQKAKGATRVMTGSPSAKPVDLGATQAAITTEKMMAGPGLGKTFAALYEEIRPGDNALAFAETGDSNERGKRTGSGGEINMQDIIGADFWGRMAYTGLAPISLSNGRVLEAQAASTSLSTAVADGPSLAILLVVFVCAGLLILFTMLAALSQRPTNRSHSRFSGSEEEDKWSYSNRQFSHRAPLVSKNGGGTPSRSAQASPMMARASPRAADAVGHGSSVSQQGYPVPSQRSMNSPAAPPPPPMLGVGTPPLPLQLAGQEYHLSVRVDDLAAIEERGSLTMLDSTTGNVAVGVTLHQGQLSARAMTAKPPSLEIKAPGAGGPGATVCRARVPAAPGVFDLRTADGTLYGTMQPSSDGLYVVFREGQPLLVVDSHAKGFGLVLRCHGRSIAVVTSSSNDDVPGDATTELLDIRVHPGVDPILVLACVLGVILLASLSD